MFCGVKSFSQINEIHFLYPARNLELYARVLELYNGFIGQYFALSFKASGSVQMKFANLIFTGHQAF
jgi:hypothetical protein